MALPFVPHMEPDIFGTPALHGAATPDAFRSIAGSIWLRGLYAWHTESAEQCLAASEAGCLADRRVPKGKEARSATRTDLT